jgi:hypothetical protein
MRLAERRHEALLVTNVSYVDQQAAGRSFDLPDPFLELSEPVATSLFGTATQAVPGHQKPSSDVAHGHDEEREGDYLRWVGEHTTLTETDRK